MDTELSEIKESVARIDERTMAILDHQEKQAESLTAHEVRDREDFRDVHARITKLERKQNWILGIGSAIMFGVTVLAAFLKGLF